jgi:hypothetical protein
MITLNVLFIALIFISIVELFLLGSWNKSYFTFGITVFKKRIAISTTKNIESDIAGFITNFDNEAWLKNMKGKTINNSTLYFREKLIDYSFFRLNYTPVMHGNIYIDSENRIVTIKGLLNSYFVFFCAFWIIFATSFNFQEIGAQQDYFSKLIFLAPIVICFVCYYIQYTKYRKIVRRIAEIVT